MRLARRPPALPRPLIARWFRALARVVLASAIAPIALAQSPGIQVPGKPAAPEAEVAQRAPEPVEQQRARLIKQLDEARAQRERLAADSAAAAVPEGFTPEESSAARNSLGQLVLALEGQLRVLDEQQSTRTERQETAKSSRDWTGFATAPPYSILLVDDLHEAIDSIKTTLSAVTAQRVIAEREAERAREQAQRSDAALRRASEAAAVARAEDRPLRQRQSQIAEWSAAAAAAAVALYQRTIELVDDQIAHEGERLKLAERKLEVASRDVRFSDEDLAQLRGTEEQRLERIRDLRVKAGEKAARQDRELASAAEALQRAEADPTTPGAAVLVARARLRAARAAVDAARFELEVLDSLAAVAAATVDLYVKRFQALNDSDAERRREAVVRLREVGARIKPWRDYARSQLEMLRAAERETGIRSDSQDAPPQVQAYESAIADTIRQRLSHAQRLLDAGDRADRTVKRWLSEIEAAQEKRPFAERLAGAWAIGSNWARGIWNLELFAVEDTIEVGGQKITTSRGVTVGKSIGALLLFIVGYWVATLLARRFERLLIARFAIEPAQARTVRRWTMAFWGFVLLVLTLNLARIPLTVFAFLGGALAIGIGFGTQTIIKNFISGMIVLMERHVRVGDTIEVDGVTGTVAEVNLRSSTVRSFDGVEAIIPNSNLLENKVINWTRSDNRVRRLVKVGVAYGSPVRLVADLLLECLDRHGQVLKQPEPQVLFEDFGDSALVFAMYFWLELKPGVNSMAVMSDLRFMVHRRLDEAGIAVPYPQRDVHLNAARPLQVELRRGRREDATGADEAA